MIINGIEYLTHQQVCQKFKINKDRFHKICKLGFGPKRIKATVKGSNAATIKFLYRKEDIDHYTPVSICVNCEKPAPMGTWFCCEACRVQWRSRRKTRQRNNGPNKRMNQNGMQKWPVVCPICHKEHTICARIQPNKWVYCPEHVGRRTWIAEGSTGRVVGCFI